MNKPEGNKALMGTSILLAITSSLCCILPILGIVGGIGGAASSLKWIEPMRPYLVGLTVVVLGFAFYRAYKPQQTDNCGCEVPEKKSFMASKKFLWIITIVSVLLMTFPYYSSAFTSGAVNNGVQPDNKNIIAVTLRVEGMNCEACENHVNTALLNQDGVTEANTDYENGTTQVKYDTTKVYLDQLIQRTEEETGYTIKP